MPAIKLFAKDFKSRTNLERYISAEIGQDEKGNKAVGHTIEGTREELTKLNLDDESVVYGLKCIITDTPTKDKVKIK